MIVQKHKRASTARPTSRAGAKAGFSDPTFPFVQGRSSTDKSYSGDNRLIGPKSSYRRPGLTPQKLSTIHVSGFSGCDIEQSMFSNSIKTVKPSLCNLYYIV